MRYSDRLSKKKVQSIQLENLNSPLTFPHNSVVIVPSMIGNEFLIIEVNKSKKFFVDIIVDDFSFSFSFAMIVQV